MSEKQTPLAELLLLCAKVRDDAMSADDTARLDSLLQSSAQAKEVYVQYMLLVSLLESRGLSRFNLRDSEDASGEVDDALLRELAELERCAEATLVPKPEFLRLRGDGPRLRPDNTSLLAAGSALFYMVNRPIVWASLAAGLVLAVTLVIVFAGGFGKTSSNNPIAQQPDNPSSNGVVATLTSEYGAQWESRTVAPGDKLYSGQQLTLTKGFAKITTSRGAVAIVEAPSRIEFMNNPNAVYLHHGRLVGVCDTKSSQGFFVRTPQMDITDLGTRFGVDASDPQATEVHVFVGEVEVVQPSDQDSPPTLTVLEAGQAVRGSGLGDLKPVESGSLAFVFDPQAEALRPRVVTGSVLWLGSPPRDLGQDQSQAQSLQAFLERDNLLLREAVPVDCRAGRAWDPKAGLDADVVEAGERVDVYLLHYDLVAGHESPEEFVIDFGRPILGVIGSQTLLNQTDRALGVPGMSYPQSPVMQAWPEGGARGLNIATGSKVKEQDTAWVGSDGQTLHLRLWGGLLHSSMDQVRVIVRASEVDQHR